MIDFENIGKTLPYRESDAEVDEMLARIAVNTASGAAERQHAKVVRHRFAVITSAAAAIALAAGVAFSIFSNESAYDKVMKSEDMAVLLEQMDDEAVEGEVYYTQNCFAEY